MSSKISNLIQNFFEGNKMDLRKKIFIDAKTITKNPENNNHILFCRTSTSLWLCYHINMEMFETIWTRQLPMGPFHPFL